MWYNGHGNGDGQLWVLLNCIMACRLLFLLFYWNYMEESRSIASAIDREDRMLGTRRERERERKRRNDDNILWGTVKWRTGRNEPKTRNKDTYKNEHGQPEKVTTYIVGAKRAPNAAPAPNKPLIRPWSASICDCVLATQSSSSLVVVLWKTKGNEWTGSVSDPNYIKKENTTTKQRYSIGIGLLYVPAAHDQPKCSWKPSMTKVAPAPPISYPKINPPKAPVRATKNTKLLVRVSWRFRLDDVCLEILADEFNNSIFVGFGFDRACSVLLASISTMIQGWFYNLFVSFSVVVWWWSDWCFLWMPVFFYETLKKMKGLICFLSFSFCWRERVDILQQEDIKSIIIHHRNERRWF